MVSQPPTPGDRAAVGDCQSYAFRLAPAIGSRDQNDKFILVAIVGRPPSAQTQTSNKRALHATMILVERSPSQAAEVLACQGLILNLGDRHDCALVRPGRRT
jgi:hypothetical protein